MRTTLIAAAFVICAGLSLTPKVMSAITGAHHAPAVPSINLLSTNLMTQGYRRLGSRLLSNDGVHTAIFYGSEVCGGWIAIVRLSRNSEGAHLLPALFGREAGIVSYYYEGDRYEAYPILAQITSSISDLPRMLVGRSKPSRFVYLIFETGGCHVVTG